MARASIGLDDEACARVMERFRLGSKREAVDLAPRRLAVEPLALYGASVLEGSGWKGDLDEMRGLAETLIVTDLSSSAPRSAPPRHRRRPRP